ncbi:hypothetical protein ABI59_09975 [Acidobacteria bacterium Mor1]|nr:hypothetical protein ABI59_09975 [Acidobacteria bacterium Mor1]
MRDFDFLLGRWRVKHHRLKERLAGSTEWEVAEAVDEVRSAFLGQGNIGCFRRVLNDAAYEGVPIRLFDPRTELWSIYWLDTVDRRMEPPVIGRFDGDRGEFIGDDHHAGRPIKVRFVWSGTSGPHPRWEQSFSADGGRSWELNSIMEFERA